ncbi:AsmA-like C-terminal region-containing protein [uncultured Tateyamaria sp.]|uniref:AsmA family protein n=1 Tax=uncultured Tateyamaria sp. TaxID=455651 RepID=UPI00260C8F53|nr:AsmA-like C-terminal region-containing protein [uncultured Tateyamaria sp.]
MTAFAFLSICAGAFLLRPKLDLDDVLRDGINQEIGRIAGEDVKLHQEAAVSVRPNFRVVVTDPLFESAEGSGPEGFLTSSRIDAALRIAPLFMGRGEIANLHLYRPRILLDHNSMPVFSSPGGLNAGNETGGPTRPASIVITDGILDFAGESSISGLNLSIVPRNASQGISASGDFISGQRRTYVELQADDPQSLFSERGSKGTVSIRFETVDLPEDIDQSGDATESSFLTNLRHTLTYMTVFGSGPLVIDGHFTVTPDAIRISSATFSKGGIALQGNFELQATEDTSVFPKLQELQASVDAVISDVVHKIGSGDWPTALITTNWLNGLEIDFDLEGQDIAFGGAAFDTVSIALAARKNGLSFDVAAQGETLGRFEASTAINQATEVAMSAKISDASLREIMQPISRKMQIRLIGTPQLPEGALNAELELAGRGQTFGEVFDSFAGSLTASMEDGSLTGADVTATLETLANGRQFMTKEKGPLIPAAGRTRFDLIDGEVGIEAGTARISRLSIAGERLEIDMLGEVGLKDGAVYVSGNAQLSAAQETEAEQIARNVDLPFGIGGTLFSPMVAAGVPQFEVAATGTAQPSNTIQK